MKTFIPKAQKKAKILKSKTRLKRIDPYYWMNKRGHPDVLSYIKQEQKYFNSKIKNFKTSHTKVFKELKSKIPGKEDSPPYPSKNYFYWSRYKEKKEYPLYYRKKIENHIKSRDPKKHKTPEEIILDVNQLAKKHKYYDISELSLSFSQNILAFSSDQTGRRFYTIYFKDLRKNKILSQKIPNTAGSLVWANNNQILFYIKQDPKTLRSFQVFRYDLKTKKSTLIFEEKDETFSVSIYKTLSEKYIFIQSSSTMTTECRFVPADKPLNKFKIFKKRKRGHKYFVSDGKDYFYILTNSENCKNYRLDYSPCKNYRNWKPFLPHNKNIYVEDFEVFSSFIALEVREESLTQILILDRKSRKIKNLKTHSSSCRTVELGANALYDCSVIRFEYESMIQPKSVYDHHISTQRNVLIKRKKLAKPFLPKKYFQKRIFAPSKDGQSIPISLIYKKNKFKKNHNPLYLYGYGSYGYSLEPHFYHNIFSLVDRGFVFAIAHVRGGAERGKWWYEEGRLLNKKNTFNDFIDCSEYLIQKGLCHPQKLYAGGGSAGGLLMGAVINKKPELYKGVIAHVPFVDVLTTMQDETIPLTIGEYDEWGNPNNKLYHDYIYSYSPYDNVKKGNLPNVLVTSGYHDSQVQYWEPLKWTARLRENQTNTHRDILLFMDMESGHSGATGRFKKLKLLAMEYAFLLHLENINL